MRKLRADSSWNDLSTEQLQTLEGWLLDENLSYRETQERLKTQWNLTRSISSIARYRRHRAMKRTFDTVPEVMEAAREVNRSKLNHEELRESARLILGKRFLEQAATSESTAELALLGRLLMHGEEREIRRLRLAFARERWQFNIAKAVLETKSKLKEFNSRRSGDRIRPPPRAGCPALWRGSGKKH